MHPPHPRGTALRPGLHPLPGAACSHLLTNTPEWASFLFLSPLNGMKCLPNEVFAPKSQCQGQLLGEPGLRQYGNKGVLLVSVLIVVPDQQHPHHLELVRHAGSQAPPQAS